MKYSIIIPYYNKKYEINLVLKSLSLLIYDRNQFEIIIADDGSECRIDDVISKYDKLINISYLYSAHYGNRGKNRNVGIEKSSGKFLLFLDSDMLPERTMLTEFDKYIGSNENVVAMGLRKNLHDFDKRFIDETIIEHNFQIIQGLPYWPDERTMYLNHEKKTGECWIGKWQFVFSHCLCISKDKVIQIGGFDNEFGINWGAEDVELGYRLYKVGCQFELCQTIMCYHLFHPTDMIKQLSSLQVNYSLFLKKHPHWPVELFVREYESWSNEIITIQKRIIERKHIQSEVMDVHNIVSRLPSKTLLVGVESKELLQSQSVIRAFIPESKLEDERIENRIGINTEFPDNSFELALLSMKYAEVNEGLFRMVAQETLRISKKVFVVNEREISDITDNDYYRDVLLFIIPNHDRFLKSNFINLALAASELGMKVGIEYEFDIYNEIELNQGFLRTYRKEKKDKINKLRDHELCFLGNKIPSIVAPEIAMGLTRSLGKRILWYSNDFINSEKDLFASALPAYERVFVQRKSDIKLYPESANISVLPIGIERQKIEITEKSSKRKNHEKMIFLTATMLTNTFSNLDIVLETFTEQFGRNDSVLFRILTPENKFKFYQHMYLPDNSHHIIKNGFDHFERSYSCYYNSLKNKFGSYSNIEFVNALDEEQYTEEIYQSDCFLYLNSVEEVFPLVLESIALGKKPVLLNNGAYDDYVENNLGVFVNTELESTLNSEGTLENLILSKNDRFRYCLRHVPRKEELKNIMNGIYKGIISVSINDQEKFAFRKKYSWENIARMLQQLLTSDKK